MTARSIEEEREERTQQARLSLELARNSAKNLSTRARAS